MARQYLFPPAEMDSGALRWLVAAGAVGCAAFVLLGANGGGAILQFTLLLSVLAAAWATWRWPVAAAVFLVAFTSVNRFIIFVLFSASGSSLLLRCTQLWKDEIVLILLIRVIHDALERRQAPRVYLLDLLVVMFLALNFLYVIYPGTLADSSLLARLLGFRLDAYFLFAYFVGRGLHLRREHVRWVVLALIPGSIIVALVAAFQWLFPGWSNDLWNSLGFQEFVTAVHGSSDIAVRTRDLAGVGIPRASSLLMGDLALSFYTLLVIPFAVALYFTLKERTAQRWAMAFLALMLATLAMSGSRSAIVAVPLVIGVLTFWTVSYHKVKWAIVAGVPVAIIIFFSISSGAGFFGGLTSPEEGSTVAHADALEDSLKIVEDEPLGRGLGTAHTVGFQLGIRESFASESWYLQLGTETGVAGIILYSLVILFASVCPLVAYLQVKDIWLRILTLGAGGAGLCFLLVGLVLHVWEAPVIAAAFWLLAGIAVSAPALEKQWEAEELQTG